MKRAGELALSGEEAKRRISSWQDEWPYEIVNEVDSCPFPDIEYVDHAIAGPGVDLSVTESLYPGCNCDGICINEDARTDGRICSCIERHGLVCDKEGRLRRPSDERRPLVECSWACRCTMLCPNRLVQRNSGGNVPLQIFRTPKKGWGVRVLAAVRQWTFVCEYAGHVIRWEAARQRERRRKGGEASYLVVLKEHATDGRVLRLHVDASHCGNAARFINHSCDPNLVMVAVRSGHLVPRLALFACKDINAGEELTFSYSGLQEVEDEHSKSKVDHLKVEVSDSGSTSSTPLKVVCFCESPQCKGYLPFDRELF